MTYVAHITSLSESDDLALTTISREIQGTKKSFIQHHWDSISYIQSGECVAQMTRPFQLIYGKTNHS